MLVFSWFLCFPAESENLSLFVSYGITKSCWRSLYPTCTQAILGVRPERFRSWPLSRSRQEAGRSKAIGYEPVLSHRVVFCLAYLDIENSMISSARPKWRLVHAGVFFLFILYIRCHWEKKKESVHLLHRCSKFNIIKIGSSKLSSTSSQKWCYFFSKYNSVLFRWKSANHESWTSSDESLGK